MFNLPDPRSQKEQLDKAVAAYETVVQHSAQKLIDDFRSARSQGSVLLTAPKELGDSLLLWNEFWIRIREELEGTPYKLVPSNMRDAGRSRKLVFR